MMEHERFFRLLMVGLLGLAGLALIPATNSAVPAVGISTTQAELKQIDTAAAAQDSIDLEIESLNEVNQINSGHFKPQLHATGRANQKLSGQKSEKFNADFAEAELRELENSDFEHSKVSGKDSSIQL